MMLFIQNVLNFEGTLFKSFIFYIMLLFLSSSIKNVCQMLMTLGVGSRDVYKEDFEKPFLDQSADFYRVSRFISCFLSYVFSYFKITFN